MIAEILCRLQAQKLPCFRSVSKPWCALIDGPNFIKIAFKALFGHNGCFTLKELNHPLMCYNHGIKVLGSVNGLLCVSNVVDDIAVWNPTIRKYCVDGAVWRWGKRSFESEVKVYSLKKQSWGRIGDMP
uniref:F-box domain-containing protein n=1 Tax=Populus trichocarpa TaxID=3694 RepID=A0A2K1X924_POPTR